jgi:surface protein
VNHVIPLTKTHFYTMKKLYYLFAALLISPKRKLKTTWFLFFTLLSIWSVFKAQAQNVTATISPANTGRVTAVGFALNCTSSCSGYSQGFATINFTPFAGYALDSITGYRVTNRFGARSIIKTKSASVYGDWYYGGQLNAPFFAAPSEIDLQGRGVSIPDGDTSPTIADNTDLGLQLVASGTNARTFTIQNTGVGALGLSGSPKVTVSGPNASDFTVSTQPGDLVIGGSRTTFVVTFDPSALGVRSATISINNSDTDEGVYNFNIQGTGVNALPEINVKGNNTTILNGDTFASTADDTNFGSQGVSSGAIVKTFTIENTGAAALNLNGSPRVVIGGTHASDFTVSAQPASPLTATNGISTFQVTFDPSATGTRRATISIDSDDNDEIPYTFAIQGTGTGSSSEMNLKGNGVSIANNDVTPSINDHTDFGSSNGTAGTIVRTFTIESTGAGILTLSGNPRVSITGAHAEDFTVTTQPASTVAATNGNTTFQISFDPSASGLRTATVSIDNDDTDEDPYTFAIQGTASGPFITTWKTNNPGTSNSTSITIPANGTYDVDWDNDGNYDQLGVSGPVTHNFGAAGTYTVAIRGGLTFIRFEGGGDRQKILSVDQWGDITWTTMFKAFEGCSNLNVLAADSPDLSNVFDLSYMFQNATSLNANLNGWDVSNVTNMFAVFLGASSFNQPLSNWNVSQVTDFSSMFEQASVFNQPLNAWTINTAPGATVNMQYMFTNAVAFNQDLNSWNVSRVTNMSFMFQDAAAFNGNITNWNVGNVTAMDQMFRGANSFNQPIGGWNVSNVTNMYGMFANNSAFNQPLSNWNVSKVTDFEIMFGEATSFNQPLNAWTINTTPGATVNMRGMFSLNPVFNQNLNSWNVSRVTNMSKMFERAIAFNGNITNWNVSNVIAMDEMYLNATSFNQNLANWNIGNATSMQNIFLSSGISKENYDAMLIGWNTAGYTNKNLGNASPLQYCAGQAARINLTTTKGWTITGDTYTNVCFPPEINLKGNNVSIANGDTAPSAADHTDFGAQNVSSGTIVRTFTVENTHIDPFGQSLSEYHRHPCRRFYRYGPAHYARGGYQRQYHLPNHVRSFGFGCAHRYGEHCQQRHRRKPLYLLHSGDGHPALYYHLENR